MYIMRSSARTKEILVDLDEYGLFFFCPMSYESFICSITFNAISYAHVGVPSFIRLTKNNLDRQFMYHDFTEVGWNNNQVIVRDSVGNYYFIDKKSFYYTFLTSPLNICYSKFEINWRKEGF